LKDHCARGWGEAGRADKIVQRGDEVKKNAPIEERAIGLVAISFVAISEPAHMLRSFIGPNTFLSRPFSMDDEANSAREAPSPATPRSSTMRQKIWAKIEDHLITSAIGLVGLVLAGLGATAWLTGELNRIIHLPGALVDKAIITTIEHELAKPNSELKETITKLIIDELSEKSSKIPQKIQEQAKELFNEALKSKIGPMAAGRFTLDRAKREEKVDVYWKEGHSAWLWVYLEALSNADCILIQPPTITARPRHVVKRGLTKSINIARMLAVQSGSQSASGQEHDGDTVGTNKGIFDNVHQLTFRMGTKDTTGLKCNSEIKNDSGRVDVEYFMATAPLVNVPPVDEIEPQ
jgi:hypothetical protein